jgi:acyl-CoA thioester hydrolase
MKDTVGRELGWPRVACACEYFGPVRFEDELEFRLRVMKVGGKSFSYEVDFMKAGQCVAQGKVTSVCCAVEPQGGFSAIAIPPEIREKLALS